MQRQHFPQNPDIGAQGVAATERRYPQQYAYGIALSRKQVMELGLDRSGGEPASSNRLRHRGERHE
jgi:hypothetical protein